MPLSLVLLAFLLRTPAAFALDPAPAVIHATPRTLDPEKSADHARKDAAVVIAVEDYASIPDATDAKADADAFAGFLTGNADVPAGNVLRLDNPSAAEIRSALVTLKGRVRKNGTIWLYFAGHGGIDAEGARVVLPADVAPEFASVTGVPLTDLAAAGQGSKAARAIVVVDAGFGGIGRNGEELYPGNRFEVLSAVPVPADAKTTLWTATSTAEASALYPEAGHSMFTYFAVGALRGWADGELGTQSDGAVSLGEAQAYTNRLVRAVGGPLQKPVKELRAAVAAWPVSSKNIGPGPTRPEIADLAAVEGARRIKAAQDAALAEATAVYKQLPPGVDRPSALRSFVSRYDDAAIVIDGLKVPIVVPEVGDARTEIDSLERADAAKQGKKKKRGKGKAPPPPPPPVDAVSTAACDDLVKLEPAAMVGQLTEANLNCLEARIAQESQQTERDKTSRVLMVNAEGRGDMGEWMRLAARHLEVIDRSDPDLCYRYALLLSRGEVEDAPASLRWIDYALENKHVWQGPTYTQRVYALLGLRSQVAARLWLDAEQTYVDERSEDNEADASKWRGTAKDSAREWLDYARVSNQPTQEPGVLCRSAAGNEAFCSADAPAADPAAPSPP